MKKIVALILALSLVFALCGCGKSKEATAVDKLILEIGEVSIDSKDAIEEAYEAYNALSEEDKKAVENYSTLAEAKTALKEILFADLVERQSKLNYQCDTVSTFVYLLWKDVGPSEFSTYLEAILYFKDEYSLDNLKKLYAQKSSGQNGWIATVWVAGLAIDSQKYQNVDIDDEEKINEIVEKCISFSSVFNSLPVSDAELSRDISAFIKAYKDEYPEEVSLLREWNLESSLYVDFATEPSGSLISYQTQMDDFQSAMKRFQKEAESLR